MGIFDFTDEFIRQYERRNANIMKNATAKLKEILSTETFANEWYSIEKKAAELKSAYSKGLIASKEEAQAQYTAYINETIAKNPTVKKLIDTVARQNTQLAKELTNNINQLLPNEVTVAKNKAWYTVQKYVDVKAPNYNLVQKNVLNELQNSFVNNGQAIKISKNHVKFPRVNTAKTYNWNSAKAQQLLLNAIKDGKSVQKLSKDLLNLQGSNLSAAKRNARTAVTSARNSGQLETLQQAKNIGVDVRKEWLAYLDGATRDSHRHMNGEVVELNDTFSNGLRYPGDPNGAGAEIYNCRCTMVGNINGKETEEINNVSDETYVNWLDETFNEEESKSYRNREKAAASNQKQVQAVSADEILTFPSVNALKEHFGSTSTVEYGKEYTKGKYKGFTFYNVNFGV